MTDEMALNIIKTFLLFGLLNSVNGINVTEYPGELCNRECVPGQTSICYFKFVLEHYQAMGVACGNCLSGERADCDNPQCVVGDGITKGVMSINRNIPGPAIQVCKDDLVIVDVVNAAAGSAAAIHWHGIHMIETPHMDGVPFITQCPIPFSNTFRYKFLASEPGTQFYHSHAGHHKINGQYGALIVRQSSISTPQAELYDYDLPEHHILMSDWMHEYGEQLFPGVPDTDGIYPDAVLINGRGIYTNPKTKERTIPPPTRYFVEPGKKYRFRVINSISHACPVLLQIEGHNLTIISSDSYDVLPATYDSLVSNAGERYDFILEANHTKGDFWIRVRGMGVCALHPTESFALLRYKSNDPAEDDDDTRSLPSMPLYEETYPLGEILNHPNTTCFGNNGGHCVSELLALDVDEDLRNSPADFQFYIAFNNYPVSNAEIFKPGRYNHFINLSGNLTVVGAINNLSLIFPEIPLLTQPEDIDESKFCDEFHWPAECLGNQLCPCIHRLHVPLNSIVELILVDESKSVGRMHHPFHLHGYRFMVTGLDQHPNDYEMDVATVKRLEGSGQLLRSGFNPRPPFKDTVSIPSRGYTVVRLRATNPGFWLMHCHYEWHLSIGMGLVLQVGETSEMVKPPVGFPKCGSYTPDV
jgi:FtsP/CotA-like multicopper oxidase with cupredoxin domain